MDSPAHQNFLHAYDEHADALFRHAFYRTGNREMAKDLVQETFCRVWAYVAEGKNILQYRAFLYRTLNNLVIDSMRKKQTDSLDTLSEHGAEFPDTTGEGNVLRQVEGVEAMRLLHELPDDYRAVLVLRYIDDYAPKEIATMLDISESAASVRIHRGIEKLKALYDHHDS